MSTRKYQAKKYSSNTSSLIEDALAVEGALQININKKPFSVTMRTPGEDFELVRGLLHAEGIIKHKSFIPNYSLINKEESAVTKLELQIPEDQLEDAYSNSRSLLSVSSCGICGKTELEDLDQEESCLPFSEKISFNTIQSNFKIVQKHQETFEKSGGSHAAGIFSLEGEVLAISEDIGRHNAVDKVVGKLLIQQNLKEAFCLTVSGRISYEIVVKCFKARIPVLCAVSAPSSLAVDFAKEFGITLLAFCREDRATCYAYPERLKEGG